jgi:hypothetical protein
MNFFGKVLIALTAIASIFLLAASLMVYATHRNWKDDYDKLKTQLTAAQTANQELEATKNSLESQLTAEKDYAVQEASKLVLERDQLAKQNADIGKRLEQLDQTQRDQAAALAATQANNEKLTGQVAALRGEIRTNQSERDHAFTTALQATDDLHQADNELTVLRERNSQLAQEVGNKTALLDENGIDPATDPGAIVPRVRGIVSKTQSTSGSQLIEVTVGADDGLKPGHTVEVFRGDRYLGRAEILKTEPDRAVGRILRQFQQGQIEEGDDVATRFRIS